MAAALFVTGLVLVALAVGFLAGLWWGVLLCGALLALLGVLTHAATPQRTATDGDTR